MTQAACCSGRAHQQVAHRRCAHEQVIHPRHRRLKHGCLTPVARRAHHRRHPPTVRRRHKKQALWTQRSACVATLCRDFVMWVHSIHSRLARARRPPVCACGAVVVWATGRARGSRRLESKARGARNRSRPDLGPMRDQGGRIEADLRPLTLPRPC